MTKTIPTVPYWIRSRWRKPCPHHSTVLACITCGQQAGHHKHPCLCQDFRTLCPRCGMRKSPI